VRVGATGTLPPNYTTAWDVPRVYRVPSDLIHWGGENVIAVRVYDGENGAGMYPGPVLLRTAQLGDFLDVRIGPANANGVYVAGEPVAFSVTITSASTTKVKGKLACTWTTDSIAKPVILATTKEILAIPAHGSVVRTFSYRPKGAGFVMANLVLELPGGAPITRRFVLGSDIDHVTSAEVREPDFDAFWAGRKAALEKIPPKFTLTPQPEKSTTLVTVAIAEMVSYGGVRIRGWYTVPRTPGPHPGLLQVPGYGAAMQPATGITGAAVLALDIRGHGISKQDFDPKDREYMWEGIDGPLEDYVYVGAFLDCIRGLDFLASRPEVDASRLGVEGGSQGGGLTLATAGLDPRVIACAPDVPWLVDWPDYETHTSWAVEFYPKMLKDHPSLTMAAVRRTLSYVDAATFAGRITCPVFQSIGLQDDTCPPRITVTAYNRIRAPKTLVIYPYGGHDGGGDVHEARKTRWMMTHLGAGPAR
jgi:cephalosporin-C deacetylase